LDKKIIYTKSIKIKESDTLGAAAAAAGEFKLNLPIYKLEYTRSSSIG
jgi:hypothetical protein